MRDNIRNLLVELRGLSEKYDYTTFEIALVIFLRSEIAEFDDNITDTDIEELEKLVEDNTTIMSDYMKEEVDYIVCK